MNSLRIQTSDSDGTHRDYFYDGKTLRATYTVKNGRVSGIYREYDRQGRQIIEAPFKDGMGAGMGWVLENGKKVNKQFRGNLVLENGELFRNPSYSDGDYWKRLYIEKNKK